MGGYSQQGGMGQGGMPPQMLQALQARMQSVPQGGPMGQPGAMGAQGMGRGMGPMMGHGMPSPAPQMPQQPQNPMGNAMGGMGLQQLMAALKQRQGMPGANEQAVNATMGTQPGPGASDPLAQGAAQSADMQPGGLMGLLSGLFR